MYERRNSRGLGRGGVSFELPNIEGSTTCISIEKNINTCTPFSEEYNYDKRRKSTGSILTTRSNQSTNSGGLSGRSSAISFGGKVAVVPPSIRSVSPVPPSRYDQTETEIFKIAKNNSEA